MVFLMVPVFTCKHKLHVETSGEKLKDWVQDPEDCTAEQKKDMQHTIMQIA